jgi:hypothetical protein
MAMGDAAALQVHDSALMVQSEAVLGASVEDGSQELAMENGVDNEAIAAQIDDTMANAG